MTRPRFLCAIGGACAKRLVPPVCSMSDTAVSIARSLICSGVSVCSLFDLFGLLVNRSISVR